MNLLRTNLFRKKIVFRFLAGFGLLGICTAVGIWAVVNFYGKPLKDYILAEISEQTGAEAAFSAADLNAFRHFPYVSVAFADFSLLQAGAEDTLFRSREIFFTLNLSDLLRKKYRPVQLFAGEAELFLHHRADGKNNFEFGKESEESTEEKPLSFDLRNIKLENFRFRFKNAGQKWESSVFFKKAELDLSYRPEGISAESRGEMITEKMQSGNFDFRLPEITDFALDLSYLFDNQIITISKGTFESTAASFSAEGTADFAQEKVDFLFSEKNGDLRAFTDLLPEPFYSRLNAFVLRGKADFAARISGSFAKTLPSVRADFAVREAGFVLPDHGQFGDISLRGHFDNGAGATGGKDAVFVLEQFSGKMPPGDFSGKLKIQNLDNPTLKLDAGLNFDAEKLRLPGLPDSLSGFISAEISYAGPADFRLLPAARFHAAGRAEISDLSLPVGENSRLEKFSAELILKDNLLIWNRLSGRFDDMDIESSGRLLSYEIPAAGQERFSGDFEFSHLKINKLQLKNARLFAFSEGSKILAELKTGFSAGGKWAAEAVWEKNGPAGPELNAKIQGENVALDSLFRTFENFGQDYISAENLTGRSHFSLEFSLPFRKGEALTDSLRAQADVHIKDGKLRNWAFLKENAGPLQKRIGEEIVFSELQNTFYIENRNFWFPQMHIRSDIGDFYIWGSQDFDLEMDYRLRIPLRNLSAPASDFQADQLDTESEGGTTVFLRLRGKPDNFRTEWDGRATANEFKADLRRKKEHFLNLFRRKEKRREVLRETGKTVLPPAGN